MKCSEIEDEEMREACMEDKKEYLGDMTFSLITGLIILALIVLMILIPIMDRCNGCKNEFIRDRSCFCSLEEALKYIHQPSDNIRPIDRALYLIASPFYRLGKDKHDAYINKSQMKFKEVGITQVYELEYIMSFVVRRDFDNSLSLRDIRTLFYTDLVPRRSDGHALRRRFDKYIGSDNTPDSIPNIVYLGRNIGRFVDLAAGPLLP